MNASDLKSFLSEAIAGTRLLLVSNREPYLHERVGEGIRAIRPASGMVSALEPIIKAVGGTWIAHGAGSADRQVVDEADKVSLPPGKPRYSLRRVWLTRKEEEGYYYGLANRAIWPLCHIAYTRPRFIGTDWEAYRQVNIKFARAVLEEAAGEPAIVFLQDYHLALLPRLIRNARPDLKIVHFWHIPWPNREAFRIFPWGEEMLDGLLGNDLLGFHIQHHCNNFLDTIDRAIEARVDYEHFRVYRGGHPTYVRPFPISVDFEQIATDADSAEVAKQRESLLAMLGGAADGQRFIVGVERIDYTKGIPERLMAFDLLLKNHPELKTRVTMLQLSAPSRTHVEEYRQLNDRVDDLVDEINWRHQTEEWVPVQFLRAHHESTTILAAYRLATVAVTSSLHDGMNLVAKEFVSSRTDGDGVLILSPYTGAARELTEALQVNPYDVDRLADGMYHALTMGEDERRARMERMRAQVARNTVYDWGARIFEELTGIIAREGG